MVSSSEQAVRCALEEMVERSEGAIKASLEHREINYIIDMVRYLDDRVGWVESSSSSSLTNRSMVLGLRRRF